MCDILKKSRNLADNLNDLKAQVAANNMGIKLLRELVAESSVSNVVRCVAAPLRWTPPTSPATIAASPLPSLYIGT